MAIAKKSRLYNKILRIMHREVSRLEEKSKNGGGLESQELRDMVAVAKSLETEIKEDKKKKPTRISTEQLVEQAKEILKQFDENKEETK